MTLGIVLLQGPRRGVFLMSEVPLYSGLETMLYTEPGVGVSVALQGPPLLMVQ